MRYLTFLFLLIVLLHIEADAQLDSTKRFEKAKGQLSNPVTRYYKAVTSKTPNQNESYVKCRNPGNSYYLNCIDTVKAIYEGRIVAVFVVEQEYTLMTKYGDYFIAYSGIPKPSYKKGDYLQKGDCLGIITPEKGVDFIVNLIIMKGARELDPMKWIKFP